MIQVKVIYNREVVEPNAAFLVRPMIGDILDFGHTVYRVQHVRLVAWNLSKVRDPVEVIVEKL